MRRGIFMTSIVMEEKLPFPATSVWEIIGDVTRCDWVPAVETIEFSDGIRRFTMAGIGEVQEKIITCDSHTQCLQYSAIKTPSNVEHHLATIQLTSEGDYCNFCWTVEIRPDPYADSVRQAMQVSLAALKKVLAGEE
jgi:hypothetical protein